MTFLNTRMKYALGMSVWTLVMDLILRAVFWSDEALFSWNMPLSVAAGFLVGLALWPMQRAHLRRFEAVKALSVETAKIIAEIDEMMARNRARSEAEAMRLIEEFLKHPETGINIERKNRN